MVQARQAVDDSGEVFFAVRFRSGAVEAVPVAALCTAAQLQARSQRHEPSEAVRRSLNASPPVVPTV